MRVPKFRYSPQDFVTVCLFIYSYAIGVKGYCSGVLIYISLMANDEHFGHLFISFEEIFIVLFGLFVILLFGYKNSLYNLLLDSNQIYNLQVFSVILWVVFQLLNGVLWGTKFLLLMYFNLSVFCWVLILHLRNFAYIRQWRLPFSCFSTSFIVLTLVFRSTNHFELILYGIK